MTQSEADARRESIGNLLTSGVATDVERAKVSAVLYLADTLRPLVEAFVEATKIGGAFGPRPRVLR